MSLDCLSETGRLSRDITEDGESVSSAAQQEGLGLPAPLLPVMDCPQGRPGAYDHSSRESGLQWLRLTSLQL